MCAMNHLRLVSGDYRVIYSKQEVRSALQGEAGRAAGTSIALLLARELGLVSAKQSLCAPCAFQVTFHIQPAFSASSDCDAATC